ncbi:GNAT family N-acetyltransferase [Roseomonas xinghualingensis]|uniref:GNAT family N-acetyltransferase n=1 Tax=Roseomonas xinghualingensis TaxID=2986475 RepID=UPI0021F1DB08|nr:GNAT family N-acetyltransferase [Roseomonas sp. SXEYE001]MCV4207851.1 GNAT family N-acetyltransferase [Roseomonas sp. SXEYE001]
MTTPLIRDSHPDDVPAIARIYAYWVEHGRASFELSPPSEAEMATRREAVLAGGYPHIVVTDEAGMVLGYAYASAYRPRPAYRHTVENSVYVAPDRRRDGTGRALLEALIVRCEAADFRLMVAVIGDSANTPSIRLHETLGFHHAGVIPSIGWKHERWLDTVLMTRTLGPGNTTPPTRS